jgi:putative Mn2+ efflux pump MntP
VRVYASQELGLSASFLTQNFIMELFAVGIIAEIIGIFGFWISYFNNSKTTKIQKQKSQAAT